MKAMVLHEPGKPFELEDREIPRPNQNEAVAKVLIAGAIVILRLRHSDKLGLKKKKSK